LATRRNIVARSFVNQIWQYATSNRFIESVHHQIAKSKFSFILDLLLAIYPSLEQRFSLSERYEEVSENINRDDYEY
jgi:hypothetical protein